MKKLSLLIGILVLSCNAFAAEDDWYTEKSTHFILYYKDVSVGFINNVLNKAEEYYRRIADGLGFTRYNFWLWDNRAKIYIYKDAQDYKAHTGLPHWSCGYASVKDKTIRTFPLDSGFLDRLLPHELGHIIFREFVGFDNKSIPLWLDEGVATYQEGIKRLAARKFVRKAVENNTFVPLDKLSGVNLASLNDSNAVSSFYLESVCLVDYLIVEFDRQRFVDFCRELRDGKTLDEALNSVYPFKNLKDLNDHWLKFLKK